MTNEKAIAVVKVRPDEYEFKRIAALAVTAADGLAPIVKRLEEEIEKRSSEWSETPEGLAARNHLQVVEDIYLTLQDQAHRLSPEAQFIG